MTVIRQRTPEWYEARRLGITSTDIVAILGIDRYRSEGDVAREKATGATVQEDLAAQRRMRIGKAMERIIQAEEEAEHGITLRHVDRLITHPTIPWALTSLDFRRVGDRVIVETKNTSRKFATLPEDWEAQVRWQMGVAGYPRAHVAALRWGNQLACFDVEHDEPTFARMLAIAEDFRRRLNAGGPFDENRASIRRAFPLDDGSAIQPTAEVVEAVLSLRMTMQQLALLEERRDHLETLIQKRMGSASLVQGSNFRVTWRRAKDSTRVKWEELAEQLMNDYPERVREALLQRHSEVRPGSRRFLVTMQEDEHA